MNPETVRERLSVGMRGRSREMIAVLGGSVVVLAIIVASALQVAGPVSADLRIVALDDPHQIGYTTSLTVSVRNTGAEVLEPKFSIQWSSFPYYWDILSGPELLEPGDEAVYQLETSEIIEAPPAGQRFVIRMNDSGSTPFFVSAPVASETDFTFVANGSFQFWRVDGDQSVPLRWTPNARGYGELTRIDMPGGEAVNLSLVQGGVEEWVEIAVGQEDIPRCNTGSVTLRRGVEFLYDQAGSPQLMFGIELRGRSGVDESVVLVIFAETDRDSYNLDQGRKVITIAARRDIWETIVFPVLTAFWTTAVPAPDTVSLRILLAAHRTQPGNYSSSISHISCLPDA